VTIVLFLRDPRQVIQIVYHQETRLGRTNSLAGRRHEFSEACNEEVGEESRYYGVNGSD
jgi:hypothetical protein